MSGRLGSALVAGFTAALLVLAGCGVPTGSPPERIAASDVPYELAARAPTATAPEPTRATDDDPRVYLVTDQDRLVPRGRDVGTGSRLDRLRELLAQLATGPTEDERAEQLSTALRPEVGLAVEAVHGGVVTIALTGVDGGQSPEESRRAVAQIVLTATSLPGIDAVLLTADGERVEAPLPSGELAAGPLTAADYAVLLDAGPTSPSTGPTTTQPPAR